MSYLYGQYKSGRPVYEGFLTQTEFMAKYSGKKYNVDAYQIKTVGESLYNGTKLLLENTAEVIASSLLTANHMPEAGDYWAIQQDGTIRLFTKHEFEKKFTLYVCELKL